MKNMHQRKIYAEGDNEPLDMTEWINDVTMYKHENGSVTEIDQK